MGYTAFGYEMHDGTVCYALVLDTCYLDDLEEDIKERRVMHNHAADMIVESVEKYFSGDIITYEDIRWRILYRLDGTTVCQLWSMPGLFTYNPV